MKSLEKNWIMIRKIRRFQIWNGKCVVWKAKAWMIQKKPINNPQEQIYKITGSKYSRIQDGRESYGHLDSM
jgi:hypothetical protein